MFSKLTDLMTFVQATYKERRDTPPPQEQYKIVEGGLPFQAIYKIPLILKPLSIKSCELLEELEFLCGA